MTDTLFTRSLALPAELAALGFTLRGETAADRSFLERLYVSVRWEELAHIAWPEEAKLAFLRDQFRLQVLHYSNHYQGTDFGILERNGEPAGRLYLFRGKGDLRIVDISLLPEHRNGGVGTRLLQAVFAEARADGRSVSIHVESFNPARRLYERVGFRDTGTTFGPYHLMEWQPDGTDAG